ncbi:MAG: MFS transporter [Legionella sp.]|nr:MFS transporter [Legionella sp.]
MAGSIADSSYFVERSNFMSWVVCLSAGLFFMYEFFQLNIFDVINQPLRETFHINATQLSWMSSMYLWADILFLLPAGLILDRFSTRSVILTALLVCVLGTMGFASTSNFVLASFFHFLSGIGNAFCFLSCVVLVSRWFPPKRQALVIGSVVTMAFIGGMLAHTPFAYLYELYGWRYALFIDAFVGAVLLVWIYFVVKDTPTNLSSQYRRNQNKAWFKNALSNPQNWLAGCYTSFLNLPIMVLCALWGASYLQVVHHLSSMQASNVVSLIFVGSIIGCPVIGWLSDAQGKRKPIMIAGAIATLLTVIPLFMNMPLTQFSLSIIFFGLGFFTSTQVISYPLIAESNLSNNTGSATGIASVIIMGGGGVGQILFGWFMAKHAGMTIAKYSISDFQFAMWMFPVAAVAALIAVYLTKETYCKRLVEE